MKPTMLSKKNSTYLFDHIIDGFSSSYEGIENLREKGLLQEDEYVDLLKKNSARLIERVKEFKIITKLISVLFACLFGYMQVSGEEMDMRRTARARTRTSTVRARASRKGKEGEPVTL